MWAEKNNRAIKFFTARPNGFLRNKKEQNRLIFKKKSLLKALLIRFLQRHLL